MLKESRLFIIAGLIALFALGTMVHGVSGTTMAAEMAIADIQTNENVSCQACPNDSSASVLCDFICLTNFIAIPASMGNEGVVTHIAFTRSADHGPIGEFSSPDLAPPKYIIHI